MNSCTLRGPRSYTVDKVCVHSAKSSRVRLGGVDRQDISTRQELQTRICTCSHHDSPPSCSFDGKLGFVRGCHVGFLIHANTVVHWHADAAI